MTALLDKFKDALDSAMASAQAEVGTFLQQKARILSLPQTLSKQLLLNENAKLQDRATSLISQAQTLKTGLDNFDPFNFSSYKRVPSMTHDAGTLSASLAKLREDMQAHKTQVDQQVLSPNPSTPGTPPTTPSPNAHHPFGSPAKTVGLVVLGGAGWWAWKKWRK